MGKTEETLQLEKSIFRATKKTGVFGCFEVTIGFFGRERVDYMTYDTKGIFRYYEIKTSVSDFRSKSKNTFCGHYNYYVLTKGDIFRMVYHFKICIFASITMYEVIMLKIYLLYKFKSL